MIAKIKEWIIHRLGGKTINDCYEYHDDGYNNGRLQVLDALVNYADSLNGTDADTWCKQVYEKLTIWRDNCKKLIYDKEQTEQW